MVRPLTHKNFSMIGNWDHDFQAHRYTSQFHREYTQFTVRCTAFGENGTDAFTKKGEHRFYICVMTENIRGKKKKPLAIVIAAKI